MFNLIHQLTKVAPRFGRDEAKAAKVITDALNSTNMPFVEEFFDSAVPRIVKSELFADNISIPCIGSSLVSGQIKSADYLISAFGYTGKKHPYNICYSPVTDEISIVDFYDEPSVTISRNSVVQIVMAQQVHGMVEVEKEEFKTENILVGNIINPQNIVFAHYDSIIGAGAVDNAAAIAVLFELIKSNPEILKNTLIVFTGNEEVSYHKYKTISGYGFRVFESMHGHLLKDAKQIIVIDGIGASSPSFVQTSLDWVLQVKMLDEIRNKVYWLKNDLSQVFKYFHTKADIVNNISEKYLNEAIVLLAKKLIL